MEQTTSTDTTATKTTLDGEKASALEAERQEAERRKAYEQAGQDKANPPVGTPVAEAEAAGRDQATGLDADDDTAGRVDEAQATKDIEDAAGYRGIRTDPTPHSHYTVAGVTAGLPTPETNAGAAFLTGNAGRFAHLSDEDKSEHHSAEGVEEIAKRAKEIGLI